MTHFTRLWRIFGLWCIFDDCDVLGRNMSDCDSFYFTVRHSSWLWRIMSHFTRLWRILWTEMHFSWLSDCDAFFFTVRHFSWLWRIMTHFTRLFRIFLLWSIMTDFTRLWRSLNVFFTVKAVRSSIDRVANVTDTSNVDNESVAFVDKRLQGPIL